MTTWFAMGGYASYVWSAYGLAAFVLGVNYFLMKRKRKHTQQILKHWLKP